MTKPQNRLVMIMAIWIAALLAPCLAAAQTPVRIDNSTFEGAYVAFSSPSNGGTLSGSIAPGWQDNSSWANVTAVYRPLAGGARGGLTAQQIDVSAVVDGAVQVYQPAPVTKGRLYRFSVWLRGTPGTHALLRVQASSAPYISYAETSFVLQDAWRRYTAEG